MRRALVQVCRATAIGLPLGSAAYLGVGLGSTFTQDGQLYLSKFGSLFLGSPLLLLLLIVTAILPAIVSFGLSRAGPAVVLTWFLVQSLFVGAALAAVRIVYLDKPLIIEAAFFLGFSFLTIGIVCVFVASFGEDDVRQQF